MRDRSEKGSVPQPGIEPETSTLLVSRSTTELLRLARAGASKSTYRFDSGFSPVRPLPIKSAVAFQQNLLSHGVFAYLCQYVSQLAEGLSILAMFRLSRAHFTRQCMEDKTVDFPASLACAALSNNTEMLVMCTAASSTSPLPIACEPRYKSSGIATPGSSLVMLEAGQRQRR